MKKFLLVLVLCFFPFSCVKDLHGLFAEEAPVVETEVVKTEKPVATKTDSAVEKPESPKEVATELPSWVSKVLSTETVWAVLKDLFLFVVTWFFGLGLWRKMGFGEGAGKEAIESLKAAVSKVYFDEVRAFKEANKDRKLTTDEIHNFQSLAINAAKEIAKGDAKKLLIKWGEERLRSLITEIVNKWKK